MEYTQNRATFCYLKIADAEYYLTERNMELEILRKELDHTDEKLIADFQERMRICARIGAEKAAMGRAVRDPVREEQKLDMATRSADPAFSAYVRELFRELMRLSRAYQEEIKDGKDDERAEH